MSVCVTGMGALSILGKSLSAHAQVLFSPTQNGEKVALAYAPRVDRLSQTPPDLRMIEIEDEIAHFQQLLNCPLSRNGVLALCAFEESLVSAQLDISELQGKKIAFILGTTAGCSGTDTQYIEDFVMDRSPDPSSFRVMLRQNPAEVLRKYCVARGVSASFELMLVNNACTSATDALGLASKLLETEDYDFAFAGGTDEILFQTYYGFASLQLLSSHFRSSPFDKNRDGLLLTEGAAILCLEKAEKFNKRRLGAKAFGEIIGYESVTETFHQTSSSPEAEGLTEATRKLLGKAQFSSSDIDFISAHATGTPNNDATEGAFFLKNFPNTKITATKGYTGHCLGAVGALEVIFCMLSFAEKKLPATLGFVEADPSIGIVPVKEVTPFVPFKKVPIALSTSVGFGGVNSILLLRGVAE
ncbi:MAG: beta-ketoacyl synthase N-terminal-like domain-containing protein [Bdellovibrionota bacterium]